MNSKKIKERKGYSLWETANGEIIVGADGRVFTDSDHEFKNIKHKIIHQRIFTILFDNASGSIVKGFEGKRDVIQMMGYSDNQNREVLVVGEVE
jgi:D-aminopeptidase